MDMFIKKNHERSNFKHLYFSNEFIQNTNENILDEGQSREWIQMVAELIRIFE